MTSCGKIAIPSASAQQQSVAIEGNRFTLDGNTWTPRVAHLRAFIAPISYSQENEMPEYNATMVYNANELAVIKRFGADTIRFLVGQPGLDPNSQIYSTDFVNSVIAAVKLARSEGFIVIIGMQDENKSGDVYTYPLPNAATQSNWDMLAATFGQDQGVIFELYNEPGLGANANNWQFWQAGGSLPAGTGYPAFTAIGMQTLITHLRAEGVINTFLLDGLELSQTLDGLPSIEDPLGRVAYAVHPYFYGVVKTNEELDTHYGNASQTVPVLADEWSAGSGGTSGVGLQQISSYQPAVDLLNYLREHNIGVCGGGFDIAGYMNQNVPGWELTTYNNYDPNQTGDNAGTLVHNDFAANYGRELTAADGLVTLP